MTTTKKGPGRPPGTGNGYTVIIPTMRVRPEHRAALVARIPKGGNLSDAMRLILTEERDRQSAQHMGAGR